MEIKAFVSKRTLASTLFEVFALLIAGLQEIKEH